MISNTEISKILRSEGFRIKCQSISNPSDEQGNCADIYYTKSSDLIKLATWVKSSNLWKFERYEKFLKNIYVFADWREFHQGQGIEIRMSGCVENTFDKFSGNNLLEEIIVLVSKEDFIKISNSYKRNEKINLILE